MKPEFHGKEGRCFLKSSIPAPKKNRCCISGIKEDKPDVATKKLPQSPVQMMKPHYCTIPLPMKFQPTLTPKLQAFQQSVIKKIQELKTKEKVLQYDRIRRAQVKI